MDVGRGIVVESSRDKTVWMEGEVSHVAPLMRIRKVTMVKYMVAVIVIASATIVSSYNLP